MTDDHSNAYPHPDDYTRPGPAVIDPGRCPGGVVVHAYAVPTERLVLTRHATGSISDAEIEADAIAAGMALMADEHGICLVAYDGDTGRRFSPWEV